ncbi:glycyl-tRNA synthetase beta chain [Marchantia polymorpha subsp. ruderalis]
MAAHSSLLASPRAANNLRALGGCLLLGRAACHGSAAAAAAGRSVRIVRRISSVRQLSSPWSRLSVLGVPPPLVDMEIVKERAGRRRALSCAAVSRAGLSESAVEISEKKPQANISPPTFQQAIQRLQEYWASMGCAVMQSSNTEVGAGTMNPATFLRVLGPEPWNVAYAEPSIRPDDSRYGENPNRVQRHTQFQVILKPDPGNSQELYLGSLAALGIDIKAHDVRFVEDNWESPVLGAWGLGWEVWMDGMEITQFTYFQQAGSLPLTPVSVEITYGLERILMSLQGVDHFKKIQYAPGITYGELFLENEKEMSAYNMDLANVERIQKRFELYAEEAQDLLAQGLAIPAYDNVLKTSHAFNLLDARGAVGVTERARFFGRMRALARQCAQLWVETRERLNYPMGVWEESPALSHPSVDQKASQIDTPQTFVLEIGSEELPPQDVVSAVSQLEAAIPQFLKSRRLQHGRVSVDGTPRRLVVIAEDLAPRQDDEEKEMRGPPATKAFDKDGKPTKAAEGFCKRNNVTVEELVVKIDGKTEYVYAVVKEQSRPTLEVLAADLPEIISNLSFPKTMRWNSQVAYSRPLRWIVALFGDTLVPVSYAGVNSGHTSRVLRNASQPTIQVERAGEYVSSIQQAGIVLNMEERRESIWAKSSILAASINGCIPAEARGSLLDEVANLVESPAPLIGRFDPAFLTLPADVLTTVMRKHQRYFPVVSEATGQLLPAFIAVANGKIDEDIVRKGNEAVLRARYEDARFFYESDTSKKLADFRPLLKGITFQEKLGSMLDKSMRVEKMVRSLGLAMGLDESSIATAQEAAPLASADLATAMVMEFTNLAGIMGRHYASKEGYSSAVQEAVFESVLPRYADDILPHSDAGVLLAVADRLDSLVGLFAVGCQPTASADPFGMRRSAYGLVQALVENDKNLNLDKAVKIAADTLPMPVPESTLQEVSTFVTRRFEQLLIDDGANVELVRSVLSERSSIPTLAARSVSQMEELAKGDVLSKIVAAYARPTRIVRGKEIDPSWQIDETYFEVEEEKALWDAYNQTAALLHEGVGVDVFFEASLKLVDPLEAFFDKVFVMADDERLRNNRLVLLKRVASLPKGIAELSMLPGF